MSAPRRAGVVVIGGGAMGAGIACRPARWIPRLR